MINHVKNKACPLDLIHCLLCHSSGKDRIDEVTMKGACSILRLRGSILLAATLLIWLIVPADAQAEYLITHKDKTIQTSCYWVENSKVHLCEGGEPLALSEVSSITEGQFSPLESEMHLDAKRRFLAYVSWLLDREADLLAEDNTSCEEFDEFERARTTPGKKDELRSLRERHSEKINNTMKEVTYLHRAWSGMRSPERSLVRLCEVKSLQMITWLQSLAERERYFKTGDPTYRDYTLEHMKQADLFQESFTRELRKACGEAGLGEYGAPE
jgi:hypothetical protein